MLTASKIEHLLDLQLSEAETLEVLSQLTPDRLDLPMVQTVINAVSKTVKAEYADLADLGKDSIDCSGTGGSGLVRFNTSTASAFVLAASGLKVVKFGNRAITGTSGSFDFLDALGIGSAEGYFDSASVLQDCNVSFLYAPACYPALAKLRSARQKIGVRTIFNYVGPLLNPCRPQFRVLGVCDESMQHLLSECLVQDEFLSSALVVRGRNGLDELDYPHPSKVIDIRDRSVKLFDYAPKTTTHRNIVAPTLTAQQNVEIFRSIIDGKDADSQFYHLLVLNSGAGFYAAGKTNSIDEGCQMAATLIKDGAVKETLSKVRQAYARFA